MPQPDLYAIWSLSNFKKPKSKMSVEEREARNKVYVGETRGGGGEECVWRVEGGE